MQTLAEGLKDINNFDYSIISDAPIVKNKRGNQSRKDKIKYKDIIATFDIETTNVKEIENSFMYIWQASISNVVVIGRTWEEFNIFLDRIKTELEKDKSTLIFYVHNLSFEFQFLSGIYHFENEEVFAIEKRKVCKCTMYDKSFEFRCSYLLTNMSLDEATKKYEVDHTKKDGEDFNYNIYRDSTTELSEKEYEYVVNDVLGLSEVIEKILEINNDTLKTVPLTSTGFCRRDVRRSMRKYNKDLLSKMLPDYNIFCLLREAFRGGNTHANRYYADMILENVYSYDRVSSYPDVQLNRLYPMGEFIPLPEITINEVLRKIYKQKRACIFRCAFHNLQMKNKIDGCPYIPVHKSRNIKNAIYDNGRILSCEYLEITLTDIDFKIIYDTYIFDDLIVTDFYHTKYSKLPKPILDIVKEYYYQKCTLKKEGGVYYVKAKNLLNSIYGMSVQSPVKQSIDFDDLEFNIRHDDEVELLEKSYKRAFQSYAWGVWVTAHARYELQKIINLVPDIFVYCDTDSVKVIGDIDNIIDEYNNKQKILDIKNGAFVDYENKKYFLGLYDKEIIYDKFITMGAKKYAYEKDGTITTTIAGVNKKLGGAELGDLENFKEGFVFHKSGGMNVKYNDNVDFNYNGIRFTNNIYMEQSTYELGITADYRKILNNPNIWLDIFNDDWYNYPIK